MKSMCYKLLALLLAVTGFTSYASPGLFFDVSASGPAASISMVICLNGKASISCQNYTVSALNVSIRSTIPNRTYPSAGVKILTPGYSFSNCTPTPRGYCLFATSNTAAAEVDVKETVTRSYTVGGATTGLSGTVVLQNNARDPLTINTNGGFTFPTPVTEGAPYAVTVLNQPVGQICTVNNGSGIMGAANVANVTVSCTASNAYTVGGTVSGLVGTVVLRNNGGDNLSVNANGSFTFSTPVAQGAPYAVTVLTQPATQTCTVSNGSGTMGGANVTNVTVSCSTNTHTVGGVVSGLVGTVVLQNNGGDNLSVNANGSFTFTTPVAQGAPYAVTVLTQPATQTCTISNGSGTMGGANVTNVTVSCTTNTHTVGGMVSGLVGTVVLQNNGGDNLSVNANGSFTFSTSVAQGAPYAVTVLTQPATQTCTISNGSGTMGAANVTNVTVSCTTNTYTVGGTVSGLAGTVVLQNNGGDNLSVNANGSFTFSTPVAQSAPYAVTVLTQPAGQICSVSNGTGTMGSSNVTNVTLTCSANSYTVGGTVSGLVGTVVLQNNGGDNLSVNANGSFTFVSAVAEGAPYAVTVLTQPATQTCTISNGSGTMGGANVTNVTVSCTTNTYTVGGTVSGLVGTVVLQNNGGDDLSVNANGSFAFSTSVAQGAPYAVTILTQPATQTCVISNGSGTIGGANVTNVTVTCSTNTYTVGGTVSGLVGTVVLQNNGGNNLSVNANGSFAFSTPVAQGAPYAVTILTQPATQTCIISNGSGTMGAANVTNVTVTCSTNTYTVGGTVSGLVGTVVLQNNGGDDLSVNANGSFSFATAVAQGAPYAVTILTQPATQTCVISNGSGTIGGANVTNVTVTCSTNTYTVGGTVSGLVGTVVLQNNGGNNLSVNANGSFAFSTPVAQGAPYAVTILTQPATQTCIISNGSGTMGAANVTNVTVTCSTNNYTVGGTVSGLVGTVVLQNNGGDDLSVNANGSFAFSTSVAQGAPYAVTVLTQPATQTCVITNGSGTMGGANVTNVTVTCSTNTYTVGGTVSGLVGTVVLQNNGGDDLSINANGSFSFVTAVAQGSPYAVTILTQPATQTCIISNGSGTIGGANVTNVTVTCSTNTYTVGGTVSGLVGTVVLQNNGGNNLSVNANGSFTFSTPVAQGAPYAVTVLTQPATQTCIISNGSGTMGGANVTNVTVTCSTNTYTVGGTASGLVGTVVLQNNGGDNLSVNANGSFTFATALTEGASYAVTVLTQPATQTCVISNGSGTMGAANVTNVTVSCTNTYTVGGTVSGLVGTVVLQNNGGNNLSVNANGSFTFSTAVAQGAPYAVTVLTQPATQTCTISNGSGTMGAANVTNVTVSCTTNSYTVGGTVSGLVGTVVLQNNGGNNLSVNANGSFAFSTPVAQGAAYAVTVLTQPATQTCVISNGSGTMGAANVTNVTVTCSTNTYTVGGTASGLVGTVVLQNNGGDNLSVNANGSFTFATALTQGASYAVTVLTQPATQTCIISNGSGTMGAANVTNVTVTCSTNTYTVGGTVSGLVGTVVLQNNGGDDLSINANGSFAFATAVAQGSPYAVTVLTQPATQTCIISNGSGTMGAANVTNVTVTCTTNTFTVGGAVSGLVGTVVLRNNGGDNLSLSTDGSFTFPTAVAQGGAYAVTVFTQPATQTCTVSNGSGTMGSANVTNVTVTCSVNSYSVGGTVSGLVGTVVLQNNGGNNLSINANGSFTFSTLVAQGGAYAVTVLTQPATQVCSVSNGSGTMGAANVTNITVTCATNNYTVGGTVSGLSGTVVLQNNGGNNLSINANGSFTFSTPVAQGSPYAVTVLTQPTIQTCSVTNGSGTMGGANVTNVQVNCVTDTTTLSVDATGIIAVNGGLSSLTVTNTGGTYTAYNVSATLPSGWTSVIQNASGCAVILPGNSCTLYFSSVEAYVAQGGIVVSGDNISTPPTTALAFTVGGYLVFAVDSANTVRVIDSVDLGAADWGDSGLFIGATSDTDGYTNTSLIVASIGSSTVYAARVCYENTNGGASIGTWYLPAICEFSNDSNPCGGLGVPNIYANLEALGFGNLDSNTYWTSTEDVDTTAWAQIQDSSFREDKVIPWEVRCARTLSY